MKRMCSECLCSSVSGSLSESRPLSLDISISMPIATPRPIPIPGFLDISSIFRTEANRFEDGSTMPMLIGMDVGGTNTSGGLAFEDGRLVAIIRRRTDRGGGSTAGLDLIGEIIAELAKQAEQQGSGISRIGIGFGGPVNHERGVVLLSHHVQGWEGVPLCDILERRFQTPVVVDND